jgi:hypothetical protein
VLLGWLSEQDALLVLSGRQTGAPADQEKLAQAAAARDAVAAREPGVDQDDAITDAPAELAPHVEAFFAQPSAEAFVAEGWEVKIVDLRAICSLQQQVHISQATERVVGIQQPDDLLSIAEVTLPAVTPTSLPVQFDEVRNTWMIPSANPNLRLTGHFGGEVQPGVTGFGFLVGVTPSFVQVARHHGRLVLRDGYHRSYGLLAAGVSRIPALVRDFGVGALGVPPGLFQTDVYLGERPPLLADFLRDDVSAEVEVPAAQKMVVIHGMELNPLAG